MYFFIIRIVGSIVIGSGFDVVGSGAETSVDSDYLNLHRYPSFFSLQWQTYTSNSIGPIHFQNISGFIHLEEGGGPLNIHYSGGDTNPRGVSHLNKNKGRLQLKKTGKCGNFEKTQIPLPTCKTKWFLACQIHPKHVLQ